MSAFTRTAQTSLIQTLEAGEGGGGGKRVGGIESSLIAGLHVTSRRPCWWSRTKAFLSSGN